MWVSTFDWGPRCGSLHFDWGPRCDGSLHLIGDPGVGLYFCLETQVWVSTFDWGPRCGSLLLFGDPGMGLYI